MLVQGPNLNAPGSDLACVLNQRGHVKRIFPRETEGERAFVQHRDMRFMCTQPLHFGSENHATVNLSHDEGLDAHGVACHDQLTQRSIPQREGVHAIKAANPCSVIARRCRASGGCLRVKGQHDLAVHLALKAIGTARRAQLEMVVDLTVDHRNGTVLSHDGLLTTVEVQNGQSRMSKANAVVAPDAFPIGSAVPLEPVDAVKHGLIRPPQHAADAAHEERSQRVAFEASSEGSAKVSNPRPGKQRPSRPVQ